MKVGDRVSWETSDGHTQGTILERHTEDFDYGDQRLIASDEHPVYVVESERTRSKAVHRSSSLRMLHELHDHHQ